MSKMRSLARKLSEMTEEDIASQLEENRRAVAAGETVSPEVRRMHEHARRVAERRQQVVSFRNAVAKAMGVPVAGLPVALEAAQLASPRKGATVAAIWAVAGQVQCGACGAYDEDIDLDAVRDALLVLELVKNGTVKGIDTDAMRKLPAPEARYVHAVDHKWVEPIARIAGLGADRFMYPDLASIERNRQAEYEQICANRKAQLYDPKSHTANDALASRAAELLEQRAKKLREAEFAAHRARGIEFRAAVVRVIDDALKSAPITVGWWWLRQLRRHIAGERVQATDLDLVWRMLATFNVRVPFERVAELVK